MIDELREAGYFSALDRELARSLGRLAGERDPNVLLGVALASRQIRGGHVCADLGRFAGTPIRDDAEELGGSWPQLEQWVAALAASPLVGDGSGPTPLVLDDKRRLYLARYHQHERALAQQIRARVEPRSLASAAARAALVRLFGSAGPEPDAQRLAAMVSALSGFSVVYGGPGTGKTSTVVKLLALLLEASDSRLEPLLLAPTGKAAARLSESVERALGGLDVSAGVRAAIPTRASTIHRALGVRGDDATSVRHDRSRPLAADVVVVDESSMVDVALMRRLLDAVRPSARLILLGDAHQLASVEAGAVLLDICSGAAGRAFSSELAERVRLSFGEALPGAGAGPAAPLRDCMVELEKSHRFDPASGIGSVASAVKRGDAERAVSLLSSAGPEVGLVDLAGAALEAELARAIVRGFGPLFGAQSAAAALAELERFRLLAAHRRGRTGVEGLNRLAERVLAEAGILRVPSAEARFYPGRPIMVVENDYQLELFNGDVGVLWPGPGGALAAHFADRDAGTRHLPPSRLPPHETVFATSIHKSQGSELDEVAIVLPDRDSPLLTRELFYTALTRARRRAVVYGRGADVVRAVERRVRRDSGLAELLWGS